MEIGRNYESVIITIIGSITVLVSHNFAYFGYFMPMMWGKISVRMLPQLPPPHPTLISFSPGLFLELQEILYQLSLALIWLFQKIMYFQSKKKFSSNLLLVRLDFAILGALSQFYYHETTTSFIFVYMNSFLFGVASNHLA